MLAIALILAAAQADPAPAPAVTKKEPLVCRYETATGTIFPGRICKTRAQWARFDVRHDEEQRDRRELNTIDYQQGCTMNHC